MSTWQRSNFCWKELVKHGFHYQRYRWPSQRWSTQNNYNLEIIETLRSTIDSKINLSNCISKIRIPELEELVFLSLNPVVQPVFGFSFSVPGTQ